MTDEQLDNVVDFIEETISRFYSMDEDLVDLDHSLLEYYGFANADAVKTHDLDYIKNTLQPELLDFFENRITSEQLVYTADRLESFYGHIYDLYEGNAEHWFNDLPNIAIALYMRAAGVPWKHVEPDFRRLVHNFSSLWF